jgi:hypothetical protein
MNHHLWDESTGTYRGGLLDGRPHPPTVPAAFTALCFDLVPPARRPRVEEWLRAHHQEQGGLPYAHHFLFEALYGIDTEEADRLVLDSIRKKWAAMAQGETRTVWEGFGPGENCHEAGAVPAYFLSARVLGVQLDGPVWDRRLRIEPRLGHISEAEGVVVTELGPVPVRWRRQGPGASLTFDLQVPPGARATLALPLPGEEPSWILDGRTIAPSQVQRQGRHAVMEVGPGRHRGRLTAAPAGGRTPEDR